MRHTRALIRRARTHTHTHTHTHTLTHTATLPGCTPTRPRATRRPRPSSRPWERLTRWGARQDGGAAMWHYRVGVCCQVCITKRARPSPFAQLLPHHPERQQGGGPGFPAGFKGVASPPVRGICTNRRHAARPFTAPSPAPGPLQPRAAGALRQERRRGAGPGKAAGGGRRIC